MTSKEKLQQIRAEQDAQEQIAEEVRERVGESVWDEILRRNQYESIKRGEALTFFRDSTGIAQYEFRKATDAEKRERAEDWVEDNL